MASQPAPAKTILVVEDNPDDVHLAIIEFEDAGVTNEVVVLEDGEAALRYILRRPPYEQAARPALVLLDLHLPKVDGSEILDAVGEDPDLEGLPIIVLSVPTELGWVQEQYSHVISGVLPKPIEMPALTELVASIDSLGPGFFDT